MKNTINELFTSLQYLNTIMETKFNDRFNTVINNENDTQNAINAIVPTV